MRADPARRRGTLLARRPVRQILFILAFKSMALAVLYVLVAGLPAPPQPDAAATAAAVAGTRTSPAGPPGR